MAVATLVKPYCSIGAVRDELGDATAKEPIIVAAINAACRYIDKRQGRDYFLHDHSADPLRIASFDDAVRGDTLFLPHWPIIELTEVEVQGTVWVEGTDFVRAGDRRLVSIASLSGFGNQPLWPIGPSNTEWTYLTGKFGYEAASETAVPEGLPPEIQRAAVLIAARLTGQFKKDALGLDGMRQSIVDGSIPKEALALLGPKPVMV